MFYKILLLYYTLVVLLFNVLWGATDILESQKFYIQRYQSPIGRLPMWRITQCPPDMTGSKETKYSWWTKTGEVVNDESSHRHRPEQYHYCTMMQGGTLIFILSRIYHLPTHLSNGKVTEISGTLAKATI